MYWLEGMQVIYAHMRTEDIALGFNLAIQDENWKMIEWFTLNGCANFMNHRGWSGIHCAIELGKLYVVQRLHQNWDYVTYGVSLLEMVCVNSQLDIVKWLVVEKEEEVTDKMLKLCLDFQHIVNFFANTIYKPKLFIQAIKSDNISIAKTLLVQAQIGIHNYCILPLRTIFIV